MKVMYSVGLSVTYISTTIGWIALTFGPGARAYSRIKPIDFSDPPDFSSREADIYCFE